MSPDPVAILTLLGFGKYAASLVALAMCAGYAVTWCAPLLPATPPTNGFLLFLFNVVQKIAGNVGNAKNANAVPPTIATLTSVLTNLPKLVFLLAIGSALSLPACALLPFLAMASTVASDAVEAGTLFCQDGPTVAAVVGVTVTGATADKVAAACKLASIDTRLPTGNAVPVPPPLAPASVPVATVAPAVAAAVVASKTTS